MSKVAAVTSSISSSEDGEYDNTNDDIDEHICTISKSGSGNNQIPSSKGDTAERKYELSRFEAHHSDTKHPSLISTIDKKQKLHYTTWFKTFVSPV